ncbi:MAG: HAMP domain-containing sensor histidine kinase [Hyphomicrobiaceae bacterium]|nr:HAMP domain-containing sensor histidine kinase [Hyphomicrobiaceae bacterium]
MLNGTFGKRRAGSLMGEYSSLLGDAVLRHRTRVAEQSARIEAELAGKVKSEFISNMSHELRTPLNTVIGFSKIMTEHGRRPIDDTNIVEYAGLIHDAAVHLLSVINGILDISKIQSGRYTLDAMEVDLGEVLLECVTAVQTSARAAEVELTWQLPPELPPIRGEESKLAQIFTNLLSNAIKFTPPGGSVLLEAARLPDDGLAILVRDSGVGMSKDELQVALEPFGQVDGTRARWREGTGLGLPIAKSLVELHGGRLEIRSEKGKGTDVAIVLPSRHKVTLTQGRAQALGAGG